MFELLTLKQTRKTTATPIVLFDKSYWNSIVNFDGLVREGPILEEDLTVFNFADDPEYVAYDLARLCFVVSASCSGPIQLPCHFGHSLHECPNCDSASSR
jgi:putative lysine decarboxylase